MTDEITPVELLEELQEVSQRNLVVLQKSAQAFKNFSSVMLKLGDACQSQQQVFSHLQDALKELANEDLDSA